MELIEILKSQYLSIIFGGIAGIVTAWITQRILHKRGVFRYHVNHDRIGMAGKDKVFGEVQVTWNQTNIDNLFLSTIELKNESLNDYENVIVQTFSNDTNLLTEQTGVSDSVRVLAWTDHYKDMIRIPEGEELSDTQRDIYFGQREYLVPIFNRGQTLEITYLNTPKSNNGPSIWVSVEKKGVKVKYRVPYNQIFGVSQPHAVLFGVVIGIISLIPTVIYTSNSWIIVVMAFLYGLLVQIPGAFAIKALKKIREIIGG